MVKSPHQTAVARIARDTYWSRASPSLRGVLWMLASCAFLSVVSTIGRHAALEGVPVLQIVFLRLVFAFLVLLPLTWRRRADVLKTDQFRLYGARVGIGLIAMTSWFAALGLAPVGDVTAISFLTPIFGTVGAIVLMGERASIRRFAALALGFTGALIIVRPGYIETGTGVWLAILAACAMAVASLLIKRLTKRDDPDKVVVLSTVCQLPLVAIPGLIVWVWPTPELWLAFVVMGLFATIGQICLSRAFAAADVGVVMGVDFVRLPFAVAFGFVAFGELSDSWTWIGAAVIVMGTLIAAQAKAPQSNEAARH